MLWSVSVYSDMPFSLAMRYNRSGSVKLSGQPSFWRTHWEGRLEYFEWTWRSAFIVAYPFLLSEVHSIKTVSPARTFCPGRTFSSMPAAKGTTRSTCEPIRIIPKIAPRHRPPPLNVTVDALTLPRQSNT